jgi:hypothetical protein
MTEEDKFKLKERIYPAIQSSVNNRYKITLGIFIYYGFILNNDNIYEAYKTHPYFNLIASIVFTAFIVHNFFNYWENSKERIKYEGGKRRFFLQEFNGVNLCRGHIVFDMDCLFFI